MKNMRESVRIKQKKQNFNKCYIHHEIQFAIQKTKQARCVLQFAHN